MYSWKQISNNRLVKSYSNPQHFLIYQSLENMSTNNQNIANIGNNDNGFVGQNMNDDQNQHGVMGVSYMIT